jgi:hypothetical protein
MSLQQRVAFAQLLDVDEFAADVGEPAAAREQRGQFFLRERIARTADEDVDLQLEPIGIVAARSATTLMSSSLSRARGRQARDRAALEIVHVGSVSRTKCAARSAPCSAKPSVERGTKPASTKRERSCAACSAP